MSWDCGGDCPVGQYCNTAYNMCEKCILICKIFSNPSMCRRECPDYMDTPYNSLGDNQPGLLHARRTTSPHSRVVSTSDDVTEHGSHANIHPYISFTAIYNISWFIVALVVLLIIVGLIYITFRKRYGASYFNYKLSTLTVSTLLQDEGKGKMPTNNNTGYIKVHDKGHDIVHFDATTMQGNFTMNKSAKEHEPVHYQTENNDSAIPGKSPPCSMMVNYGIKPHAQMQYIEEHAAVHCGSKDVVIDVLPERVTSF